MDLLGISNPLATHALQRFLVGMVARAFNPGCAMDWMPILMGEQGKGKSQFAANLVPQKLFTEMPMSLSKLQTEPYRLHVAWLLELPEVDALFKANMREEFKNLVSTRADSFRRPYDRYPSTLPRKFTFLGTTNAHNFLNDPTGNRRFIPLKLPAGQEVNWRQLPHIRDRLWATALRKYQEGATYIYTSGEIKDMEEYTSQFKVEDTWESEIESYVEGMPHVTVAQVLKGLGLDPAQQSSAHNSRAAEILRKIGWTQKRKRVNGNANATRVWVPPQHVLDAIKNYEETF
jgi:predicted P-loop ATPase